MRSLLCLAALLALAAPSQAGAAAGSRQTSTPRSIPARPVLALSATPRPGNIRRNEADPAALCETAITTAEYVNRLPQRLLGAIGVTETGRLDPVSGLVRPWPWTINAEGEGRFFATRQQAIAAVKALQARGVRSVDVGCLQVNLMFHPDAFASLEDAFEPRSNAAYAARFLNALSVEGRDWPHAIAAYHSETPALGNAYRMLVLARWGNANIHTGVPPHSAYQDFARAGQAYGAFIPPTRVYGAFTSR